MALPGASVPGGAGHPGPRPGDPFASGGHAGHLPPRQGGAEYHHRHGQRAEGLPHGALAGSYGNLGLEVEGGVQVRACCWNFVGCEVFAFAAC